MDDSLRTGLSSLFGAAFVRYERALRDCPDSLWEESLWDVEETWPEGAALGADRPEAERRQVFSAFWFLAWHALDTTHYDLEGKAMPDWRPPPPLSELDFDNYLPLRVFIRTELQEYLADTRLKAEAMVVSLNDERIASLVPDGHRYTGNSYIWLLLMTLTHAYEHVAQLEMFLGQRGVLPPS